MKLKIRQKNAIKVFRVEIKEIFQIVEQKMRISLWEPKT